MGLKYGVNTSIRSRFSQRKRQNLFAVFPKKDTMLKRASIFDVCVFEAKEIVSFPDFVLSQLDQPRTIMHHPDIRTLFLKRFPKRFTVFEMSANDLFTFGGGQIIIIVCVCEERRGWCDLWS